MHGCVARGDDAHQRQARRLLADPRRARGMASRAVLALALLAHATHALVVVPGRSSVVLRSAPARHVGSIGVTRTGPITAAEDTPDADFRLAAALVVLGPTLVLAPWIVQALGGFFTILGAFLIFQTLRIRFVFDDEALEVKTKDLFGSGDDLGATGENFAVGGENRWKYNTFVNWEFFPSVDLPILVYFKETQTPQDKWDVGPGQWANGADALAKGAVPGQVHFCPCIADAQQLKAQFEAKNCAKL